MAEYVCGSVKNELIVSLLSLGGIDMQGWRLEI